MNPWRFADLVHQADEEPHGQPAITAVFTPAPNRGRMARTPTPGRFRTRNPAPPQGIALSIAAGDLPSAVIARHVRLEPYAVGEEIDDVQHHSRQQPPAPRDPS